MHGPDQEKKLEAIVDTVADLVEYEAGIGTTILKYRVKKSKSKEFRKKYKTLVKERKKIKPKKVIKGSLGHLIKDYEYKNLKKGKSGYDMYTRERKGKHDLFIKSEFYNYYAHKRFDNMSQRNDFINLFKKNLPSSGQTTGTLLAGYATLVGMIFLAPIFPPASAIGSMAFYSSLLIGIREGEKAKQRFITFHKENGHLFNKGGKAIREAFKDLY